MTEALLKVEGLKVHYPLGPRGKVTLRAVDDVSFQIEKGETLGLVGESGCGKTTLGRAVLRLLEPSGGRINFDGTDLTTLRPEALRRFRKRLQIVFQDPFASLNPKRRVGEAIEEAMTIHGLGEPGERRQLVGDLLNKVGLEAAVMDRFPHEFSGGQRQRIGIARALAVNPELIVLDEPVSALDVSVQAQVINLLQDLQEELGLSYLFIAHDLGVVQHISHRVAVMYLGQIVEMAAAAELFAHPRHPYTQALIASIPKLDPDQAPAAPPLSGEVPSPLGPPAGCRFHTRCPRALAECALQSPPLLPVGPDHWVACLLEEEKGGEEK